MNQTSGNLSLLHHLETKQKSGKEVAKLLFRRGNATDSRKGSQAREETTAIVAQGSLLIYCKAQMKWCDTFGSLPIRRSIFAEEVRSTVRHKRITYIGCRGPGDYDYSKFRASVPKRTNSPQYLLCSFLHKKNFLRQYRSAQFLSNCIASGRSGTAQKNDGRNRGGMLIPLWVYIYGQHTLLSLSTPSFVCVLFVGLLQGLKDLRRHDMSIQSDWGNEAVDFLHRCGVYWDPVSAGVFLQNL